MSDERKLSLSHGLKAVFISSDALLPTRCRKSVECLSLKAAEDGKSASVDSDVLYTDNVSVLMH